MLSDRARCILETEKTKEIQRFKGPLTASVFPASIIQSISVSDILSEVM
jgi:hypothetical protein